MGMGMTLPQMERELATLRRMVKELTQPKSKARVVVTTQGSLSKIALASTGIAARSGTTVGSASCTEYKIVGSTLTTNTDAITVKNVSPIAIPSGAYVLAVKESLTSFWIAQHPGIIDIRYVSPNLQYTTDGTTWTTWHTASTTCPP